VPSPKRQPAKPAPTRRGTSGHKPAPKKGTGAKGRALSPGMNRSRKSPGGASGGVLARQWSWNKLSIDRKLDILGIVLAMIGLLTLLSLLSPNHGWWAVFVSQLAGLGSFILPVALILVGIWLVLRNVERLPMLSTERMTGVILMYLNVLAWLHLVSSGMGLPEGTGWDLARAGLGGGYIGAFFEELTVSALGPAGAYITFAGWSLIAIALTLDISVSEIFQFIQHGLASLVRRANEKAATRAANRATEELQPPMEPISELPPDFTPFRSAGQANGGAVPAASGSNGTTSAAGGASAASGSAGSPYRPRANRSAAASDAAQDPGNVSFGLPAGSPAPGGAKTAAPTRAGQKSSSGPAAPPWKAPEIPDVLDPGAMETLKPNQDNERGQLIEETLASFGAPVKVVETHRGPTVTQFGVEPLYVENRNGRTRVRVSKIAALADDLALALAAPRIRIQAPVPGRNYVGIEVPNQEISLVALRDVMESDAYRKIKSPLRFALGKDVSGHSKAYDLTAMPHLLIAGTTGSGKSVCVNSILTCLLLNNTPTELRMILVDPKRVELTGYNGVPHLLAPVVVEAEQVIGALQWVQREMDARYHRFSQVGARNIADYNAHFSPPLPYMLVLIDELADLMMLAPDETERALTRLAQLARATGIHLVLATQRPSVDVVTGLIKANFPARVAFAVASGTDSRVILDQPGAERLLGRGDMLFQAPDAAAPVRLQGVYVSDSEIQRLVDYWRQQAYDLRDLNTHTPTATPVNMDMPLNAPLKQTPLFGEDEKPSDPMIIEATRIVREEGKASISMLQRKLRIGYTRSARLIDQLEAQGIIGPTQPTSQVREVLDYGDDNNAEAENQVF
jgi:DNA segregation ATPase FtsK/SpoIIIE, S-DNA-T family